jgi:hypothetical protein
MINILILFFFNLFLFYKKSFNEVTRKKLISVDENKFDKDIFLKNISHQNSSIVLKEKYLNKNRPQFEDLRELFNENFLRDNEKLIMNYNLNEKKSLIKSSYLKKKTVLKRINSGNLLVEGRNNMTSNVNQINNNGNGNGNGSFNNNNINNNNSNSNNPYKINQHRRATSFVSNKLPGYEL